VCELCAWCDNPSTFDPIAGSIFFMGDSARGFLAEVFRAVPFRAAPFFAADFLGI
jgi:hypothetical protein